jgi:hypothetical protein
LIPVATDTYTFVGEADTQPPDMTLDGGAIAFKFHNSGDDPPKLWASDPIRLTGGRLYKIELNGAKAGQIELEDG